MVNLDVSAADEYQRVIDSEPDKLSKFGESVKAYDLLLPYEDKFSGNMEQDYLFGAAVLDSGAPIRLFFQWLVMIDPNFSGARMERAQAGYLSTGGTCAIDMGTVLKNDVSYDF